MIKNKIAFIFFDFPMAHRLFPYRKKEIKMGLSVIYLTSIIFTIGLTSILIISYFLNRLNPIIKKPYRINSIESYYPRGHFNPALKRIPRFEELYIYGKLKKKNNSIGQYYC